MVRRHAEAAKATTGNAYVGIVDISFDNIAAYWLRVQGGGYGVSGLG